jgi:hypothetical protein
MYQSPHHQVTVLALKFALAHYKLDVHVKAVEQVPSFFTDAPSTALDGLTSDAGVSHGYKVLEARFVLLVASVIGEALLCYPHGNQGLVTDVIGTVAGTAAFAAFFIVVAGNEQESVVATGIEYVIFALVGMLIKKFIGARFYGLTMGTADAEVVQANLVISGSGGDPNLLKKKNYDGILVGSTANPSKGLKAKSQ